MSKPGTRLGQSTSWLIVLSLVATSLVAVVVIMSTSRIGTIRLPEHRHAVVHIRKGFPGDGHPPCDAVGAQCRRAVSPSRGRSTPVPPWELALAGLLAAGAVGILWKTRRTQLSDASDAGASPESSPKARRMPTNPRETVLAAFANIEECLTSRGIARETWEAPESYLGRAIPDSGHSSRAAHTLARLYALARYSHHSIDRVAATQALAASTELASRLSTGSSV